MTLDANIVIAYLNGDPIIEEFIKKSRSEGLLLFLPTVAESEVLSFSNWTPEERKATEQFLEENFTSITFDRSIARIAAEIRRTVKIKFPDAAIAATALFTKTPLLTRNLHDFQNVPDLQILSI
ncbi:MAG: hypothetical protein A2660_02760 [Candidatus Doudnabacteria bacterium RIFCSPHIGHO2_01_FULL_45_18]|uniref:PIN domain-containing protein n=1 Tax=Candidatus Doudnabacteria bacterium RIFCSPHIGHO2_01_FULL_45_18 TaxID=1817823 RepID=A0A1F5NR24_9BACT|nr:MAG: hypothetical protein A2660_02760 [Candidatus Doudnabacteria bacterium RIFCSPHIGHO2_01_FULL_45_18]